MPLHFPGPLCILSCFGQLCRAMHRDESGEGTTRKNEAASQPTNEAVQGVKLQEYRGFEVRHAGDKSWADYSLLKFFKPEVVNRNVGARPEDRRHAPYYSVPIERIMTMEGKVKYHFPLKVSENVQDGTVTLKFEKVDGPDVVEYPRLKFAMLKRPCEQMEQFVYRTSGSYNVPDFITIYNTDQPDTALLDMRKDTWTRGVKPVMGTNGKPDWSTFSCRALLPTFDVPMQPCDLGFMTIAETSGQTHLRQKAGTREKFPCVIDYTQYILHRVIHIRYHEGQPQPDDPLRNPVKFHASLSLGYRYGRLGSYKLLAPLTLTQGEGMETINVKVRSEIEQDITTREATVTTLYDEHREPVGMPVFEEPLKAHNRQAQQHEVEVRKDAL